MYGFTILESCYFCDFNFYQYLLMVWVQKKAQTAKYIKYSFRKKDVTKQLRLFSA